MDAAGTDNHPHWAAPLYDGCAAELVLYGRALGLSHGEAEDVLHDTFRALLNLASPPREPRFYLVRSFRNRALNHRRGLWRRILREFQASSWFETDPAASAASHPAESAALDALRNLPDDQREVIVLKIWHGLTFDAIASLLDLSPNTAAGRYRYGLRKLREALKDHSHDHELDEPSGNPAPWLPPAPAVPEGQAGPF